MLKHTVFELDCDHEIIVAPGYDRFYAVMLPSGGWVVKDALEQFHDVTGARTATVELADSLIGEWIQVVDNYAVAE
jgi:hypothetical protein